MVSKVEVWRASDGSFHNSFEEAQKHEFFCYFKKFNIDDEYGDPYAYFTDEAIERIWINKHQISIVLSNVILTPKVTGDT